MALDDLKETIETLRKRIQTHRAYLEGHETRTRQVLIDPMLRALGWDIENLDSVQLEHTKTKKEWIDYALMGSKGPIAVIEAKTLGKPLEDKATDQALNYANKGDIDYMVVTDGDHWQMLDVFKKKVKEGHLEDRILMDFRLTRDDPYVCALQALGLWRPNLASGEPKEAATPVLITPSHAESEPSPPESTAPSNGQETVGLSNNGDWVPLTSLKVEKGQKPPAGTNIKFPNSSTKLIQNWIDIWVSVATYLIKTGKISKDDCPVRKKQGAKLIFVQTKPIDPKNPQKGKIGNELWLFTNFSATDAHKNACWLLKEFGGSGSLSTVLVSTNPS